MFRKQRQNNMSNLTKIKIEKLKTLSPKKSFPIHLHPSNHHIFHVNNSQILKDINLIKQRPSQIDTPSTMSELIKPLNLSLINEQQNVGSCAMNQLNVNQGEHRRVNSKILSLLQIKKMQKNDKEEKLRSKVRSQSNKKIYVSVAKSNNRNSQQKQVNCQIESCLKQQIIKNSQYKIKLTKYLQIRSHKKQKREND